MLMPLNLSPLAGFSPVLVSLLGLARGGFLYNICRRWASNPLDARYVLPSVVGEVWRTRRPQDVSGAGGIHPASDARFGGGFV